MEKLCVANTCFALELYQTLNETHPEENIFVSPLSISTALAMILVGARGNTAAQLSKTFHFDEVGEVHSNFQNLSTSINKSGTSYILKLANRLYGEKTYYFLPEFLAFTQKLYNAELATADFQQAAENVRQKINQWVKEQTEDKSGQGKIPDLLASGTVDCLTKLVLVNSVYFKGNWEEKFIESHINEASFRLNKREKKKPVKMMYQKKKLHYGYIQSLNCQVLELPYKGNDLSMIILLPKDIEDDSTGLKKIEKHLSLEKLSEWTQHKNMHLINVHVRLPKFKMENTYDLNSDLERMGLSDLFNSCKADLSGMSGNRDLFISKIVHKSFVEVNEEGTEAAAATSVKIGPLLGTRNVNFTADHPFLFFIPHNPTATILFLADFLLLENWGKLHKECYLLYQIFPIKLPYKNPFSHSLS